MRLLVTAAIFLGFTLPLPAESQTSRLPPKSRSERQVEELNRNMRQDRRFQEMEQQRQMDREQLQMDIDRQRLFSNPPVTSGYGPCPAGSIRC